MSIIDWLFSKPASPQFCPFCGEREIEWRDEGRDHGYTVERIWTGCPHYRIADPLDPETHWKHSASWRIGQRTSRFDPTTGKPR